MLNRSKPVQHKYDLIDFLKVISQWKQLNLHILDAVKKSLTDAGTVFFY